MGNKWESNDKYFFKIKGIFIVCNMLPATFDVKYCAINVIYEIVVFIFFLFASMTSFMKDDDGWGRCCQRQLIFLHSQGRWQLLYANCGWQQGCWGLLWILRGMRRKLFANTKLLIDELMKVCNVEVQELKQIFMDVELKKLMWTWFYDELRNWELGIEALYSFWILKTMSSC